jgi:Protein of unknown function (DUF2934)
MAHKAKGVATSKRRPKPQETETTRTREAATDEEIRHRAYELYRERGGDPGHELDDWARAELELRGKE